MSNVRKPLCSLSTIDHFYYSIKMYIAGKTEDSDDKTYLADPLKTSNYGPKHILESLKEITGAVKW